MEFAPANGQCWRVATGSVQPVDGPGPGPGGGLCRARTAQTDKIDKTNHTYNINE